jgi:F5/8 type C domain
VVGAVCLAAAVIPAWSPATAGTAQTQSVSRDSAYTTATPLCGVLHPRQVMAPARALDTATPVALTTKMAVGDIELADGLIYVDDGSAAINVYTSRGVMVRSIPIAWERTETSFAVAPNGQALFMQVYPSDLVKVDLAGQIVWSATQPAQIDGVFGHMLGKTWVVGAVSDGEARLYDMTGHYVASRPFQGTSFDSFSTAADGGMIVTDGRNVRKYNADLRPVFYFGGSGSGRTPAPGQFDFYMQGGAVQLPDGRYLVADSGHGLELFSRQGIMLGMIADAQLGLLTEDSPLRVLGSTLYLATGYPWSGSQVLSKMRLSDVLAEALQPSLTALPLGIGAGVNVKAQAAYFPVGTRPAASAVFDGWWTQLKQLRLRYTVEDQRQAESGGGETHSVALTPAAIHHGVPLALPPAVPGPYRIDIRLFQGDRPVAAQCVDYSVGAPGDRLDLSTLPGSWNAGGVSGDRGAALANVFGMGGVRISLDWSQMLPDGTSGPTDFSAYDAEVAAASQEAAAMHVQLSVQLGSGGPEVAFVNNGTWAARVEQVVEHWKSEVHYWEAWNEPNATYGSPQSYVQNVLAPFYTAVKTADPSAQVIGGTVVGMDLGYWQGIAAAGGFKYMDIAAIHPYTGHNRSWEEEEMPAAFQSLRALMTANGAGSMPIWITEVGWWSDGPSDFFGQADRIARAELWMHALDIPVMEYLMYQGTTGDGLSFSMIEGDSLVKPSALAAMVETSQTAGRAFTSWLDTNMPMTYAEGFGPHAPGGGGTVVALWTDDIALAARIRLSSGSGERATLLDEYGAARRVSLAKPLHLTLNSSVQYLDLPAGDVIAVQPPEPFGPDVALASQGGKASASSSTKWNPAANAIDGDAGAANVGDLADSPAWGSAYGNANPELTVTFVHAERIDRVLLATSSVGSTMPGIRSWEVEVREHSDGWRVVASYSNLFYDRAALSKFPPVTTTAVRIQVERVNFGGYAGGAKPSFWPKSTAAAAAQPNDYAYGPAVIREVEAYTAPAGGT